MNYLWQGRRRIFRVGPATILSAGRTAPYLVLRNIPSPRKSREPLPGREGQYAD